MSFILAVVYLKISKRDYVFLCTLLFYKSLVFEIKIVLFLSNSNRLLNSIASFPIFFFKITAVDCHLRKNFM